MKTAALLCLCTLLATNASELQQLADAHDVGVDKCCFPPKYAWLERKYSSYASADRRGAVSQPIIRGSEIMVVSDGDRLYKYETIQKFGSLRFNSGGVGVALTFTELDNCYSLGLFDFNVVGERCSKLPFAGVERRLGRQYYVYRAQHKGATTRLNELWATRDKDGNCYPKFEYQSSSNAKLLYTANYTYEAMEFGAEEQEMLEIPPASEFCNSQQFERLLQTLGNAGTTLPRY